mgnify:CR=1 FL=1
MVAHNYGHVCQSGKMTVRKANTFLIRILTRPGVVIVNVYQSSTYEYAHLCVHYLLRFEAMGIEFHQYNYFTHFPHPITYP